MSQNVQLAAVLIAPQPAPKQSARPHTQKETLPSGGTAGPAVADCSGEPAQAGESSVKGTPQNTFDRVLNKRLEKGQTQEQSVDAEHTLPSPPSDLDSSCALQQFPMDPAPEIMQAAVQAQLPLAAVPSQTSIQTQNPVLPQTSVPSATINPVLAQRQGTEQPIAMDNKAADVQQAQVTEAFPAVLNEKRAAEPAALTAQNPADPEAILKRSQTGLETAMAKTGKELPVQPDVPADKPAAEKMPTLPEQAVQNTVDKPAFVKSPVFAAQTQLQMPNAEGEQPAPKLRAGLKNAYQASSVVPVMQKPQSAFGHSVETSLSAQAAAAQIQPKTPELNVTETKVMGIDNAAARIRAADAVTASRPAEQIAQSLPPGPARIDQQIRLTLTPAELGTVRITFREQEGEIVGLVEAQRSQTRKDLEESLPQLVSAMQNHGLQVRRIEVVQWNTPQQGTRDQLSENFNPSAEREFLHHSPDHPNGRSAKTEYQQPDSYKGNPDPAAPNDTLGTTQWYTDKSLNMYI